MEQKRYEDTPPTEEGVLSGGGELCSLPRWLPFLEAGRQKESALRTDQAACSCPATAATLAFLVMLQEEEEEASSVPQQVLMYRTLQALLQHGLKVEPMQELIVAASKQLGAPLAQQEGPRELQEAASHTLATLAHSHFNPVMTELQRHLRPFRLPSEFALLTLGRLAAANVYGSIPFLGITLATLQTVVRWILDGRRRRALCTALEQMCRAIQVYLRNWGKCSYPRISVQRFAGHLFPLYAPMARTWLPGGDPQVQAAVLKVLSPVLSILLSRREFQAQVHEDLLLLSAPYESGVDPLLVTKLLSQILEASLVNHHPIPKTLVDPLARALSHQICPRGRRQPHHRENCAEISRLFLCLARSRPSELLGALQRQLEEGREDARVTLLLLLSKVAGAQAPEVWSRRQLCVKAVKAVLRDNSARVRLATLQVIGKLLHVGYLEKVEGWPLHYIALQLAVSSHQLMHPTRRLPLGGLEEKAIEREAMDALHAAVAAGKGAGQELWVRLLSYLMRPHCAASTVPLCHALRLLAKQRLCRAAHKEGGLDPGDTPTPQEVLARLLSLAVSPLEGPGRGAAALLLLEALRPELYQEVAEHWWVEVPALVRYLGGHSKYTLEEAVWQERLLEFLRKSLHQKQKQEKQPPVPRGGREEGGGWILGLAQEFAKQLHLTQGSSIEKAFLYKALGMALSRAGEAQGVTRQLQEVLLQADHAEEGQRTGLRWCLAYCAEGQLPAVLAALSHFEEQAVPGEEELDAEPGCLHSGQGLPERARLRSALLLLYSSTVLRAPWEQLRPHLGGRIVPGILHHYTASPGPHRAKDMELVLSFTQSVSEVSLSIQGHGETPDFRLPQKQALLGHLVDILKAQSFEEAAGSPVPREVLAALWHLSQVPEPLRHEESVELAERCLGHVLALPPSGLSGDATQGLPTGTVAAVSRLVGALLGEPEAEWCQQAFQLLGYWLVSEREGQRAQAMQVAAHLLKARLQRSRVGRDGISPPLPPGQFGHFLGTLGPSTRDALGTIRKGAGQCIEALLSIPGTARHPTPEGRAREWRLQCIQRGLRSESPGEVRLASLRLAKLVARALPSEEILPFLRSLLEQLRTLSAACDQAALSWFEVAAGERRAELKDKVPEVVAVICSSLQWAEDPSLRCSLAQALCGLARHHHQAVCASLVEQPLLQPRARRELWGALATPESSQASVLKHLLRWVKADVDGGPHGVSVLIALQEVVSALGDCTRLFPLFAELCHALLRRLSQDWPGEMPAAMSPLLGSRGELETGWAGPRGLAVAVLQSILSRALPEAAQEMEAEKAWTDLEEPQSLLKGVASLGRALGHADSPLLDRLLRCLLPALRSRGGPSHGLALAFCVELVGHPLLLQRPETLGHLLSSWLAAAREEDGPLQFLSVQGLGNLAEGAPQEAQKHLEALLGTLLQGLGSPARPEVALESLRALAKAWGCLRGWHARRTLQAVARQLCEYLGHADDSLRAAAFELLGRLAGAVQPPLATTFTREARAHLVALLLHCWDPNPDVAQACCTAFHLCAPSLGLQGLGQETEAQPLPLTDRSGARLSRLMGCVCGQLAQRNPALLGTLARGVQPYLHCPWEGIRLAACQLAGALATTMEAQRSEMLDWGPLLHALQALGQDSNPAVEEAAAYATRVIQQKLHETRPGRVSRRWRRVGRLARFCYWWREGRHGARRPT